MPIWLTEEDVTALEAEHGTELAPTGAMDERTITGHIDFLQVRTSRSSIWRYTLSRFNGEEHFPRTLFIKQQ